MLKQTRISKVVNEVMIELEQRHPLAYRAVRERLGELGREAERQEALLQRLVEPRIQVAFLRRAS